MRIKHGELSPVQNKLLHLTTNECLKNGSISISKPKLAKQLNCCEHSVNNAVKVLHNRGYIEVIEQYAQNNNSRLANKYVLAKRS